MADGASHACDPSPASWRSRRSCSSRAGPLRPIRMSGSPRRRPSCSRGRQLVGLRHHWQFDEFFSSYVIEEHDADGTALRRGRARRACRRTRSPTCRVRLLHPCADRRRAAGPDRGRGFRGDDRGRRADLRVHAAAARADRSGGRASFAAGVYDPEYYVEVLLDREDPVRFSGMQPAPASSTSARTPSNAIYFGMVYPLGDHLELRRPADGAAARWRSPSRRACSAGPGAEPGPAANPFTGEAAPAPGGAAPAGEPAWGPVAAVGRALLTFQREANRLIAQHMRAIRDGETSLPLLIGMASPSPTAWSMRSARARQARGGVLLPGARGAHRARPADGPADRDLPRHLRDGGGGAGRPRAAPGVRRRRPPRSPACAWRATG